MIRRGGILIAGGYGEVGRHLSAELARRYPDAVVVAGRDLRKADALARQIGDGVRALELDIADSAAVRSALAGVTVVVNCVPDRTLHLLRAAVGGGLGYTDVTAFLIRHALSELAATARATGARVIGGAGLAPGITSVMARAATEYLTTVDTIDAALLFSLGDLFGPASLDFLVAESSEQFATTVGGKTAMVRSFTDPRTFVFPAPVGRRIGYRAPFADQFSYPVTLGVHTAGSWLALDPPWIAQVVAAAARCGIGAALRGRRASRRLLRRVIDVIRRCTRTSDVFAILVQASGSGRARTYSLVGHRQAEATAIGTALVVRALYEDEIETPGVWYPEQVLASDAFFTRLAERGLAVQASL